MKQTNVTPAFLPICISLILSLVLDTWQLQSTWQAALPTWLPIVLMAWAISCPQWINLGIAFVLGFIVDQLQGSLLGQHSLALVAMVYLAVKLQARLRINPLLQQSILIMVLLLIYQALFFWPAGLLGQLPHWSYWLSPLWAIVLWPVISILSNRLQMRFAYTL